MPCQPQLSQALAVYVLCMLSRTCRSFHTLHPVCQRCCCFIGGQDTSSHSHTSSRSFVTRPPARSSLATIGATSSMSSSKDNIDAVCRKRDAKPASAATGGGGRLRNSYLKIVMDDDSVDRMHGMAQRIRREVRERFADSGLEDKQLTAFAADGTNTSDQSPKKPPPAPLTFRPRSRNALHMTFFFGGVAIREIPPEDLVEWHDAVMARLRQTNQPITGSSSSGETESSRYNLTFPLPSPTQHADRGYIRGIGGAAPVAR